MVAAFSVIPVSSHMLRCGAQYLSPQQFSFAFCMVYCLSSLPKIFSERFCCEAAAKESHHQAPTPTKVEFRMNVSLLEMCVCPLLVAKLCRKGSNPYVSLLPVHARVKRKATNIVSATAPTPSDHVGPAWKLIHHITSS